MERWTINEFESPDKITKQNLRQVMDDLPNKLLECFGDDDYWVDRLSKIVNNRAQVDRISFSSTKPEIRIKYCESVDSFDTKTSKFEKRNHPDETPEDIYRTFSFSLKNQSPRLKNFDDFLRDQYDFLQNTEERLQEKRKIQKQQSEFEILDKCTFTPRLWPKSREILRKRGQSPDASQHEQLKELRRSIKTRPMSWQDSYTPKVNVNKKSDLRLAEKLIRDFDQASMKPNLNFEEAADVLQKLKFINDYCKEEKELLVKFWDAFSEQEHIDRNTFKVSLFLISNLGLESAAKALQLSLYQARILRRQFALFLKNRLTLSTNKKSRSPIPFSFHPNINTKSSKMIYKKRTVPSRQQKSTEDLQTSKLLEEKKRQKQTFDQEVQKRLPPKWCIKSGHKTVDNTGCTFRPVINYNISRKSPATKTFDGRSTPKSTPRQFKPANLKIQTTPRNVAISCPTSKPHSPRKSPQQMKTVNSTKPHHKRTASDPLSIPFNLFTINERQKSTEQPLFIAELLLDDGTYNIDVFPNTDIAQLTRDFVKEHKLKKDKAKIIEQILWKERVSSSIKIMNYQECDEFDECSPIKVPIPMKQRSPKLFTALDR